MTVIYHMSARLVFAEKKYFHFQLFSVRVDTPISLDRTLRFVLMWRTTVSATSGLAVDFV